MKEIKALEIRGLLLLNDTNINNLSTWLDAETIIIRGIKIGKLSLLKNICLPINVKHFIIKNIELSSNDMFNFTSEDIIDAIYKNIKLPFGCKLSFFFTDNFFKDHYVSDNVISEDRPSDRIKALIYNELLNFDEKNIKSTYSVEEYVPPKIMQ